MASFIIKRWDLQGHVILICKASKDGWFMHPHSYCAITAQAMALSIINSNVWAPKSNGANHLGKGVLVLDWRSVKKIWGVMELPRNCPWTVGQSHHEKKNSKHHNQVLEQRDTGLNRTISVHWHFDKFFSFTLCWGFRFILSEIWPLRYIVTLLGPNSHRRGLMQAAGCSFGGVIYEVHWVPCDWPLFTQEGGQPWLTHSFIMGCKGCVAGRRRESRE